MCLRAVRTPLSSPLPGEPIPVGTKLVISILARPVPGCQVTIFDRDARIVLLAGVARRGRGHHKGIGWNDPASSRSCPKADSSQEYGGSTTGAPHMGLP